MLCPSAYLQSTNPAHIHSSVRNDSPALAAVAQRPECPGPAQLNLSQARQTETICNNNHSAQKDTALNMRYAYPFK